MGASSGGCWRFRVPGGTVVPGHIHRQVLASTGERWEALLEHV